jgi:cytoskeleton protein RodZ
MRGVSLEEISVATKISLRFLEAIEREDFAKLPGGIFSRSFIRSYAHYLGLNEDQVVTEFQLAAQPQTDFDLHRMAAGNSRFGRRTTGPLIATLVAVVLLVGGYLLFRYAARATESSTSPPPAAAAVPQLANPPAAEAPSNPGDTTAVPGANPPAGAVAPGAPGGATATPGGTTPTAPGSTTAPPAGPTPSPNSAASPAQQTANPPTTNPSADNELVLQVAATERAWVAVDADGKTVLQRVLNPDEVQTLKARKSFDVTTGNAQGTILTLNGETLKPLGREGEVKTVHLSRADLKPPTP